ncbi:MAG: HDOD domain-containing protein [Xanthomonadales bacterium]|nr:HDOD domain-containing protein [Xanthomonadales bacterium]
MAHSPTVSARRGQGTPDDPKVNINGLYTAIFSDIQAGKIPLPSLPHLALQIRTVARNKNSGFMDLGKVVETDPGAASYVIKMANSPAFGGRYPAENLKTALNRLGGNTLVNVITTYSLKNLFRSKSVVLKKALRDVWISSAQLGATCATIARSITKHDPDRALLAGLLANIGALPLINAASQRVDLANNPGVIDAVIDRFSRQVGVMMLQSWGFDDGLIDAVRHRGEWHRDDSLEPDLTDLVLVGGILIRKSGEDTFEPPALQNVPAVLKFAKKWPGTDWTPQLLNDLAEDVRKTQDGLGG